MNTHSVLLKNIMVEKGPTIILSALHSPLVVVVTSEEALERMNRSFTVYSCN